MGRSGAASSFLLISVFVAASCAGAAGSSQYSQHDWVSYPDLRYVSSIAAGLKFVYFGTSHGIAVFDNVKEEWNDPITVGDGLPVEGVELVGIDGFENRILFSAGPDIYSYDQTTQDCRKYSVTGSEVSLTSMGVDPEYIWAEGENLKVRFEKSTGVWSPVSGFVDGIEWFGERSETDIQKPEYSFLAPFYVLGRNLERYDFTAAVKDGKTLWVGTWGHGVYKYNLLDRSYLHLMMGVMGTSVGVILLDGESFWFGYGGPDSPGISRWDMKQDAWEYFDRDNEFGLYSNRVSSMAANSEFVWIGTREGLARFDKKKRSFRTQTVFNGLPANEITCLCRSGDTLWIGTEVGPSVLAIASGDVESYEEVKTWINGFVVEKETLWVATEDGVFLLDMRGGTWAELEDPEGLLRVSTTCMQVEGGVMWFGTGRGVIRHDRASGTWERFTYPAHLPDERVTALGVDDENVWVGTARGLARFEKAKKDWVSYHREDGLMGEEVGTVVSADGYVYVGTDKGLTRFHWEDPFRAR